MYQNTTLSVSTITSSDYQNQRSSENALYQQYYAYGMSIAIRYVNSKAEALTILNDTFLKVFNNLHKFDETKPYKPWFRKILVNTAINYAKSKKKYNNITIEYLDNIPASSTIESQMDYEDLMTILNQLSAAYRKVFNLYVIEGFKHHEIAELLDISVGTSKSNLTRARQKLRILVSNRYKELRA